MKICYLANSRFPSERAHMVQIVSMCNAFARNGHEVTLLVTNRATPITERAEDFYGTKINFTVQHLSVPDIVGRIHVVPSPLRPLGAFLQKVCFAYRAWEHLTAHAYDMVYGRDEWIVWILMHMVRQRFVYESHEAKFSIAARAVVQKLSKVIVISEGIRDEYVRRGVLREKLLVAHDGVDARFFEPLESKAEAQAALGIDGSKPVVLYIGGLDAWKGVEVLFQAASPESPFRVYVIGGNESEITRYRNKYPYIHFLGSRPYRELPRNQQAGDVLVIPNTGKNTLSSHYTSPLKLFAHMTSKKPLVVARIPSMEHIVSDRDVWFFAPDDPASLRESILAALHDTEATQRTDASCTKSLSYTWNARANAIVAFVEAHV